MRGFLLFAAAFLGCSASSTASALPDASSDGATVDAVADASVKLDTTVPPDVASYDAPAMDDAIAGMCNKLVNDAPLVTGEMVATDLPTPTGGVIRDGVYVRSRVIDYTGAGGSTGPSSETERAVLWLSGGTLHAVTNSGSSDLRYSATYETMGTALSLKQTCPMPQTSPYNAYSVSGDTITFQSATLKRALVLTRR